MSASTNTTSRNSRTREKDISTGETTTSAAPKYPSIGLLYLGTAILGSLVQYVQPPSETYFSDKRNLFNVVFVKFGWGWTSMLYLPFVTLVFAKADIKKAAPFWFRWLLATLYWYIVTQSFVGPSVSDRFFTLSGGACSIKDVHDSFTCKIKGGSWAGGHDMSGHCMLLIHASLFLWEELRAGWFNTKLYQRIRENVAYKILGIALVGLWFLWWWMLLMTNVYFHSFNEKISGVMSGFLYWIVAYQYIFPATTFPGTPNAHLTSISS